MKLLESGLKEPTERGNGLADGSDIREELNCRQAGKGLAKTLVSQPMGLEERRNKDIFCLLMHS